jgi:hypothetical protein
MTVDAAYAVAIRVGTNVLDKLESQPNVMFASKVGAYPSEAPFKCSTLG